MQTAALSHTQKKNTGAKSQSEMRTCPYCGEQFMPRHKSPTKNNIICSKPRCRTARLAAHSKAYRELVSRNAKISYCAVCGIAFEKTHARQVRCDSQHCQDLFRQFHPVVEKVTTTPPEPSARKTLDIATCAVCGEGFIPKKWNQVVCDSEECRKARRRSNWRKHYNRRFRNGDEPAHEGITQVCAECGTKFVCKNVLKKTCSAACKLKNQRRYYAEWYRQKTENMKRSMAKARRAKGQTDRAMRLCLGCGQLFDSYGKQNRICSACKLKDREEMW